MGEEQKFGGGPGAGGRVQEFTWDGEVVWDFKLFTAKQLPHHDITRLPNGNILMIVWDKKTPQEALAAGRRPELNPDNHLLPDSILEIKRTGKTSGEVVWEWHLWDHLIQDFDKTKANYGSVADHPELVNMNYGEDALAVAKTSKDQQEKLKSIGYVGAKTPSGPAPRRNPDWTHCNAVAYNPELDQIILSVHGFSEFWFLDHSTTTTEAAGHSGGRYGKGGDLLYRYGNPLAYRAGQEGPDALLPAQCPLDSRRTAGDGARDGIQQRQRTARRRSFVGRRVGFAGGRGGKICPQFQGRVRAGQAGLELHRAQEERLLFLLHLRRPATA